MTNPLEDLRIALQTMNRPDDPVSVKDKVIRLRRAIDEEAVIRGTLRELQTVISQQRAWEHRLIYLQYREAGFSMDEAMTLLVEHIRA